MNDIINGDQIGSAVLNSSGGAYAKRYFGVECINFSWVDFYLRDEILRKKIQTLNDNIQKIKNSPIHKDELKAMFQCAISNINSTRLSWFVEKLKAVQARQGEMINSYTVQGNRYIPAIDLSKSDVDAIFSQLPEEGVSQADIDAGIQQMRKEIARAEEIINRELSPPERWVYKDDGKSIPYPQGCRWTQYVIAWRKIAPRCDGPASVEGSSIKNDSEMTAYVALGLNNIRKVQPLRKVI